MFSHDFFASVSTTLAKQMTNTHSCWVISVRATLFSSPYFLSISHSFSYTTTSSHRRTELQSLKRTLRPLSGAATTRRDASCCRSASPATPASLLACHAPLCLDPTAYTQISSPPRRCRSDLAPTSPPRQREKIGKACVSW